MIPARTRIFFRSAFVVSFCIVLFASCGPLTGTNTGNPSVPRASDGLAAGISAYAFRLAGAVCSDIVRCYSSSEIKISDCVNALSSQNGATEILGAKASSYKTINDLSSAENRKEVLPSLDKFNSCTSAISNLNCSDPLLTDNFDPRNPVDFGKVFNIFGASPDCSLIY